jgi:hypothetical protein
MLNAVDAEPGASSNPERSRARPPCRTADHASARSRFVGGVRLDSIQLESTIEQQFGAGLGTAVQHTAPSEVT